MTLRTKVKKEDDVEKRNREGIDVKEVECVEDGSENVDTSNT